jgi:hypothetical protein
LQELLQLNPGLATARLVPGTAILLAQSVSNPSKPLRSEAPQLPPRGPLTRFDDSIDALVRDSVVTPVERTRLQSTPDLGNPDVAAQQEACRIGALNEEECRTGHVLRWRGRLESAPLSHYEQPPQSKPLSQSERALLNRIRMESSPVWRRYGSCNYQWSAWRLSGSGSRTTEYSCGKENRKGTIAVNCSQLLVNGLGRNGRWEGWRKPSLENGEDEMTAALCANVR